MSDSAIMSLKKQLEQYPLNNGDVVRDALLGLKLQCTIFEQEFINVLHAIGEVRACERFEHWSAESDSASNRHYFAVKRECVARDHEMTDDTTVKVLVSWTDDTTVKVLVSWTDDKASITCKIDLLGIHFTCANITDFFDELDEGLHKAIATIDSLTKVTSKLMIVKS